MRVRPMRGQVVVREVKAARSSVVWTPDARPREVTTHTGRVLAMGAPARTPSGVEVPHGFGPGSLVQYHFTHLEKLTTRPWTDGEPAVWVPQECIDAVWDDERVGSTWGTEASDEARARRESA